MQDSIQRYERILKKLMHLHTDIGTHNESNRVQWIKQKLQNIPCGSMLLDAGAGEQQFRKYCTHLNYVSQDFAQYDGVGNGRGLQTNTWDQTSLDIVSDITSIPRPDGTFDAVLCVEVLEHLPNPLAAIEEIARLIKKGGYLILTAPFCSMTHFAPYHYSTGFNRYFYEKHLVENGLSIIELKSNGSYFEYIAQEIRRLPWAAEHYAHRKINSRSKILMNTLLKTLQELSMVDSGSNELLCFGYHIFARKQ